MLRWIVTSLTLLVSPFAVAEPADAVFLGDHIITMEKSLRGKEPTALAIRGGKIVWRGDRHDAGDQIGSNTRVVELGERALLPGFIDAHGHFLMTAAATGMANVSAPPVGSVTDIPALQRTLSAWIAQRGIPDGQWVVGFGYDDSLLVERRHPTRVDLDAVSTRHPILLAHVSGHLMAVNSAALTAIGISADTPDPAGGIIRRQAGTMEPDGVMEETATMPFRARFAPAMSAEVIRAGLLSYAAFGITTIQDGASDPGSVGLLTKMADDGVLTQDIVAYPVLVPQALGNEPFFSPGDYQRNFRVGGIKLILDGSPQGKTAYLSSAYVHPPHGQDAGYKGYPTYPQAQVDDLVSYAISRHIPLIAHTNGDAAADMLLDAVDKALAQRVPRPDHRTVMIHAQTVREDQLDRMQTLGVIPSFFSAHTFYWGDWHRDSVLGPARAARISPTRTTLERGMHFTVHNDAPIVPADMVRLLWATTNRLTRTDQVLGADQRIDTWEALNAMTGDAAWQYFEETGKGTLTPGKQADLVVLNTNPLALPRERLLELRVEATWAHGREIYRRQTP